MSEDDELSVELGDLRLDQLRVICQDCVARADLLWISRVRRGFTRYLRVRCHDVEEMAILPSVVTRRAKALGRSTVDLFLYELHVLGEDALVKLHEYDEAEFQEIAETARHASAVLKNKTSRL